MCIVLAAPLGGVAALLGGAIGRAVARARSSDEQPLLCIALLPALFALEAAMPPTVPIASHATIDIAAAPTAVWAALTSDAPIVNGPGLVGLTGLAYLDHPILGPRLHACVAALQDLTHSRVAEVFGAIDPMKLRSSLTLFQEAGGGPMFTAAIDRWFDGETDGTTLSLLVRGGVFL